MTPTAGHRLKSAVSDVEVIVVRAPNSEIDLRCGGTGMQEMDVETSAAAPPTDGGETLLGKRYHDETTGLELLCTKAGAGSLTLGDAPFPLKDAKPLPSSD